MYISVKPTRDLDEVTLAFHDRSQRIDVSGPKYAAQATAEALKDMMGGLDEASRRGDQAELLMIHASLTGLLDTVRIVIVTDPTPADQLLVKTLWSGRP